MKTVLIQPYFGKFPVWIDLFLYSCGRNPNVDFVFFTDCRPTQTQSSYANITFRFISFQDYCKLVSDRLGIDFKPKKTYKLCDLKPFLGVVHHDIISAYDCWGYCDIDLVFGDLNMLLEKMETYDLISTHTDRLSGHFTLMRTNSKFTRACFKIWKWKKKLLAQEHRCLDESDLTLVVSSFMYCRDRFYDRFIKKRFSLLERTFSIVTDFILFVVQDKRVSYEEYYTTPVPKHCSRYLYDISTGKVIDLTNHRELPYLHFLFFKKTPYLQTSDYWKEGFYHLEQGETFENRKGVEINKQGIFVVNGMSYD